jgi:hypothetical protein
VYGTTTRYRRLRRDSAASKHAVRGVIEREFKRHESEWNGDIAIPSNIFLSSSVPWCSVAGLVRVCWTCSCPGPVMLGTVNLGFATEVSES